MWSTTLWAIHKLCNSYCKQSVWPMSVANMSHEASNFMHSMISMMQHVTRVRLQQLRLVWNVMLCRPSVTPELVYVYALNTQRLASFWIWISDSYVDHLCHFGLLSAFVELLYNEQSNSTLQLQNWATKLLFLMPNIHQKHKLMMHVWSTQFICSLTLWVCLTHLHTQTHTHTHATVLQLSGFCLAQPGWAGSRRNIHPLTSIIVISCPLSASFI